MDLDCKFGPPPTSFSTLIHPHELIWKEKEKKSCFKEN